MVIEIPPDGGVKNRFAGGLPMDDCDLHGDLVVNFVLQNNKNVNANFSGELLTFFEIFLNDSHATHIAKLIGNNPHWALE